MMPHELIYHLQRENSTENGLKLVKTTDLIHVQEMYVSYRTLKNRTLPRDSSELKAVLHKSIAGYEKNSPEGMEGQQTI